MRFIAGWQETRPPSWLAGGLPTLSILTLWSQSHTYHTPCVIGMRHWHRMMHVGKLKTAQRQSFDRRRSTACVWIAGLPSLRSTHGSEMIANSTALCRASKSCIIIVIDTKANLSEWVHSHGIQLEVIVPDYSESINPSVEMKKSFILKVMYFYQTCTLTCSEHERTCSRSRRRSKNLDRGCDGTSKSKVDPVQVHLQARRLATDHECIPTRPPRGSCGFFFVLSSTAVPLR